MYSAASFGSVLVFYSVIDSTIYGILHHLLDYPNEEVLKKFLNCFVSTVYLDQTSYIISSTNSRNGSNYWKPKLNHCPSLSSLKKSAVSSVTFHLALQKLNCQENSCYQRLEFICQCVFSCVRVCAHTMSACINF